MSAPASLPGRPRDGSIDARALAATRALLAQEGYERTTVTAVAQRAGLHTSALYRRWPTRAALIEAAVSPADALALAPPQGELVSDLQAFLSAYVQRFSSPEARAAAPGLLLHYATSPDERPGASLSPWSTRPHFRALLAASPAHQVDRAVDPDGVFDMLLGALFVRTLLNDPSRDDALDGLVDLVQRLVRPAA